MLWRPRAERWVRTSKSDRRADFSTREAAIKSRSSCRAASAELPTVRPVLDLVAVLKGRASFMPLFATESRASDIWATAHLLAVQAEQRAVLINWLAPAVSSRALLQWLRLRGPHVDMHQGRQTQGPGTSAHALVACKEALAPLTNSSKTRTRIRSSGARQLPWLSPAASDRKGNRCSVGHRTARVPDRWQTTKIWVR